MELKKAMLVNGQLPQRIVEIASNSMVPKGRKLMRSGVMGYVTRISNLIVNYEAIHFDVKSIMLKVPSWIDYTTGSLATTNEVESRKIGVCEDQDAAN